MDRYRPFTFDNSEDSYWNDATTLNDSKNVVSFMFLVLFCFCRVYYTQINNILIIIENLRLFNLLRY